jgi:hypothetical protein
VPEAVVLEATAAAALELAGGGAAIGAFCTGAVGAGGNVDGGVLPPAGNGLPPWDSWSLFEAVLLRAGLLSASCSALEKSWPPTPLPLESKESAGLNCAAALLG